jgi:glycosyltransferase 2 family protein
VLGSAANLPINQALIIRISEVTHYAFNRAKFVRLTLCLAVSALCLYLAARGMDFGRTLEEIKRSSPMPVLSAVLFLFVSYWIRAYRWQYLLLALVKIPVRPLFRSTMIGFMGNYLLPFRAGEVMRAVSISQTQSISKAAALGSIVLERVFDGVVISLTPFLILAAIDLPPWVMRVNVALLTLYVFGLFGFVIATQRGWTNLWIEYVSVRVPISLGRRIKSVFTELLQGMSGINHAGALLPVLLLSFLCWLVHALYFFLLFQALDLELSFEAALILQMVIGLGVILPAAPGYVGNFEYFTVLALALFGVTQEVAFAYALLAHICQFIPVTTVGLFFAIRSGFQSQVEAASTQTG